MRPLRPARRCPTTRSWRSWRRKIAERPLRDVHGGVGEPRHERVPTAPRPRPGRCQGDCRGSTCPRRRSSGYYRLHVGSWRVLYRPDGPTVTVHVLKVGPTN
ncbi:type II toxin-antitoxin system RelE/ParE family toxin [Streptomyces canus]|uniref:type II toxin-antitoxin system RelE family toxin n=1 Tax=Streptomyces canus TaxID=58343 RepID=UPI0038664E11